VPALRAGLERFRLEFLQLVITNGTLARFAPRAAPADPNANVLIQLHSWAHLEFGTTGQTFPNPTLFEPRGVLS
jgi:hypothetical protein